MAATLDDREARPLTSREISKVLCAILTGVSAVDAERRRFEELVRYIRVNGAAKLLSGLSTTSIPTWRVAFAATVVGLEAWCAPVDINTALVWLAENMSLLYPAPPIPQEN